MNQAVRPWLRALLVAICLSGVSTRSDAEVYGSATFRVEGNSTTGAFCALLTLDDSNRTVFGNPVNLGTSAGQIFCTGTQTPALISGHCESTPDNTHMTYDFVVTSQAPAPSGFALATYCAAICAL